MEILVTLVISAIGLVGIAGMQVRTQQTGVDTYQRAQALILLSDMVDRINTNRKAARCYDITTDTANGAPYLGTDNASLPTCTAWGTAVTQAQAITDMVQWDQQLKGASEFSGADTFGAMIGARGCLSYDVATNTYRVSVVWQGLNPTVDPTTVDATLTCGSGLYGDEALRRAVSTTFQIANLS